MGPPCAKRFPQKYRAYLKKQRDRRRRERASAHDAGREAVAALRKDVDRLRSRGNQHMRAADGLRRQVTALQARLQQAQAAAKEAKKSHQASEDALRADLLEAADREKHLKQQNRALQETVSQKIKQEAAWQLWWERVQTRASQSTLSLLRRLSRPPPASRDACWGGGQ